MIRGGVWISDENAACSTIAPDGTAKILAEGIAFANGLAFNADESYIYVCQTFKCNVIRYSIHSDGTLGAPEQYGPQLGEVWSPNSDPTQMGLTDGCGFDEDGNLWVTLVSANRIVAVTPSGDVELIMEDPEGDLLQRPTNVTWGGPDLRDLYIGSLKSDYVLQARSPVAGLPLVHQRPYGVGAPQGPTLSTAFCAIAVARRRTCHGQSPAARS